MKAELRTMLRALKATPDPVILVVSGDIYSSVVRHGNGQLDKGTFRRLVTRQMADAHYAGWVR